MFRVLFQHALVRVHPRRIPSDVCVRPRPRVEQHRDAAVHRHTVQDTVAALDLGGPSRGFAGGQKGQQGSSRFPLLEGSSGSSHESRWCVIVASLRRDHKAIVIDVSRARAQKRDEVLE